MVGRCSFPSSATLTVCLGSRSRRNAVLPSGVRHLRTQFPYLKTPFLLCSFLFSVEINYRTTYLSSLTKTISRCIPLSLCLGFSLFLLRSLSLSLFLSLRFLPGTSTTVWRMYCSPFPSFFRGTFCGGVFFWLTQTHTHNLSIPKRKNSSTKRSKTFWSKTVIFQAVKFTRAQNRRKQPLLIDCSSADDD